MVFVLQAIQLRTTFYHLNTILIPFKTKPSWKEAVLVPILKKGDPKELKNYRPVSCLTAASKVLEKVVCEQLTRFAEVQHLLPTSQHGFRTGRSTLFNPNVYTVQLYDLFALIIVE